MVQSYWNHWPCLFPQHGPGRKHERALTLEDWQRLIVTAHPADFLRGLMHSDGCRVNNWATRTVAGVKKRYDYPRWQFVNHSSDIRAWCYRCARPSRDPLAAEQLEDGVRSRPAKAWPGWTT